MDLVELVRAVLRTDMLTARQWVADAQRIGLRWSELPEPLALDATERAVAAALVGLLASRVAADVPAWVGQTPASLTPVWLIPSASRMPRLRRDIEENCPAPLRRKGVYATANYLTIA